MEEKLKAFAEHVQGGGASASGVCSIPLVRSSVPVLFLLLCRQMWGAWLEHLVASCEFWFTTSTFEVDVWCLAMLGTNALQTQPIASRCLNTAKHATWSFEVCWPVESLVGGIPARIGIRAGCSEGQATLKPSLRVSEMWKLGSSHALLAAERGMLGYSIDLVNRAASANMLRVDMGICPVQEGLEDLEERVEADVDDDDLVSIASTPTLASSEILEFLHKVPLFKRLQEDLLPTLAPTCASKTFLPGDVVIEQGDEGHELFVIRSGICSVQVNGHEVAQLKDGDYFGENALLRAEPRNATIVAKQPLTTIIVRRSKFEELGLREKLVFKQRNAQSSVCRTLGSIRASAFCTCSVTLYLQAVGGGFLESEAKPPSPKTEEERRIMAKALKENTNLQGLVSLDESSTERLIDTAWKEEVKAGTDVITEGDLNASFFYMVKPRSGKFDVIQLAAQLALIYTAPRAATVKAVVDSELWVIDRTDFKAVLAARGDKCQEYVALLDKVDLLKGLLKPEEKEALAKSLTEMSFSKDEMVFEQGEKGDAFYILTEGQVAVIKDGVEQIKLTATLQEARYFGERALLTNEGRAATIKVTSDTAKFLRLDRLSFEMLLGSLEELKKLGTDRKAVVMNPAKMQRNMSMLRTASQMTIGGSDGQDAQDFGPIERKQLKTLGILGCGGFGFVELVEHALSGETFALKAISKGYIVKSGMKNSVLQEKAVHMQCDSLFIVRLFETYNSPDMLYFLMEAALGGELYATYNRKGFFGKDNFAKFYVAGVVLAFDHLHGKKIIYRDLKPETCLRPAIGRELRQ
ncbi:egl-4 [Symbiodinium sp. CCMP2592]|nr:egl-4 [Symbiodinium sp. CCMP2592]